MPAESHHRRKDLCASCKVGFSPEKLRPYTAMPADFTDFWDKAKAEQAQFPLTYTKEHVEKYSTDKIDCYLVKLPLNKRGQCIYGGSSSLFVQPT